MNPKDKASPHRQLLLALLVLAARSVNALRVLRLALQGRDCVHARGSVQGYGVRRCGVRDWDVQLAPVAGAVRSKFCRLAVRSPLHHLILL